MICQLLFIGTTELLLIGGMALLLFGGKKLPEMMRGLGQGVREFKKGVKEVEENINDKEENGSIDERAEKDGNEQFPLAASEAAKHSSKDDGKER